MTRRRLLQVLVTAAVALAALAVLAWTLLLQWDGRRNDTPIAALTAPRVVAVQPGESLRAVANRLSAEGLLEHPGSWIRLARREDLAGRIRAGEYRVEPGASPRDLLSLMVAGRVHLHALTIPEGWTFREAVAAVRAHPAIAATPEAASPETLVAALGLRATGPEGQLFPDTYLFPRGTRDLEVLRQAHQRMQAELSAAWEARAQDLPIESPYQALVLASIIEKETGAAEERPLIAGVFVNRLRLGMRLQTDPTVIYGMGEAFDGNLRRVDLERDTPYNTYTRAGLPPTPIALPGRAALRAAVNPADTEALYFVATGRGDGRHFFARSLAEHNGNVARYIANLRGASKER